MNKSKREQNSIVVHFSFYLILLISGILVLLLNIWPRIDAITQEKLETSNIYKEIESTNKKGVDFKNFRELSTGLDKNNYTKEILKVIDKNFYDGVFKNDTDLSYMDYLKEKEDQFNSPDNIEGILKIENEVSMLLPSYTSVYLGEENNMLSDFKFINYIERLLDTFNLSSSDGLGISGIDVVDGYTSITKASLDNNIYYIPLSLSLSGTKNNILRFLYFTENLANVTLDNEDKLKVYSDGILFSESKKMYARNPGADINIYKNQFFDISNITFSEYIDGAYQVREDEVSLFDFINNTQANQPYNVDLELKFYVKSVENYKLLNEINKISSLYTLSLQTYTKLSQSRLVDSSVNFNAQNTVKFLNEIKKKISTLKLKIAKAEKMEDVFIEAKEYEGVIDTLNAKNGNYYIVLDVLELVNKTIKSSESIVNNQSKSDAEKNKAKNMLLYLESISEDIESMSINEGENQGDYLKRISSKIINSKVKEIYYQIDIKK